MDNKELIDKLAKAAVKIETLKDINESHRKINGELRQENKMSAKLLEECKCSLTLRLYQILNKKHGVLKMLESIEDDKSY